MNDEARAGLKPRTGPASQDGRSVVAGRGRAHNGPLPAGLAWCVRASRSSWLETGAWAGCSDEMNGPAGPDAGAVKLATATRHTDSASSTAICNDL